MGFILVVYDFCILKRRQLELLIYFLIDEKQGSVSKHDNGARDHSLSTSICRASSPFLMFLLCANFFLKSFSPSTL